MSLGDWSAAVRAMQGTTCHPADFHRESAVDWLLRSQAQGSGGFAHSYSLVQGWRPGYPETTGYIIPTLLEIADRTGDKRCRDSAMRAGQWLLEQQGADGSFRALSGEPYVFDTGQALAGLVALFRSTGPNTYAEAAERAAGWIVEAQETDGGWIRHAWGRTAHSYYVKVAAALLQLDAVRPDTRWRAGAVKNLSWTLAHQQSNGWFVRASFSTTEPPLLHTIVYVLEGLLDAAELLGDGTARDAAGRLGEALLEAERRDGLLYARYDHEGHARDRTRCLPGMAQWATVAFKLARLESRPDYAESALRHLDYLKARQVIAPGTNVDGAHPASVPFWSPYVRWSFVNWASKYFLDALLAAETR